MVGLAQVDDARGDHDAALRRFEAAVTLVETAVGDGDLALVPVFQQIANSHARSGDHEQAARAHERIHSLLRDQLGEHPSVAAALFDIGNSLEAAGDPVEARAYHERALVVWEHTRGKDHPDLAYALTTLGLLDVEAEQAPQAVERLERALKLRGGRGLDPRLLAHTQFALARALHATGGDPPRARELATKARDTFASGKSTDPARAAEIESWLETAALGPASR
jgi:tetratricopeptide (TPR) repeat protein